jgi:glycerophosphoryl diester phosphodiesterase
MFLGLLFVLLLLSYLYSYFSLGPVRETRAFFNSDRPLIIAHQGGALLAPSNTLLAFEQAYNLGVDILEFDIHMTKDGHLVGIHDATVDRTTNGTGRVDSYTLEELQQLDAGYWFEDLDGNLSYRGKGAYIPTVEEIFTQFPDIRMNIEIKDSYPLGKASQIELKLWQLIQQYDMQDKVLVVSFQQAIIDRFNNNTDGNVAVGSPKEETTYFVIFHKFFLNGLFKPTTDALQIPTSSGGFDLTDAKLIKGAHKLNMYVHYWTIDDPEQMRKLLELGADGIITNRPDLLIKVMEDMGYY